MLVIERMQDFSEIVPYEQKEIPLYIRTASLSEYPGMSAPCHWHEDLEWIWVLEGSMYYDINGKRLLLQENDALMVNARQMHYGSSKQKKDCRFACVLFHPSLFCSNPALLRHYVTPVLQNCGLEYLHFTPKQKAGTQVTEVLDGIVRLKETAPDGYELESAALMQLLWSRLWHSGILTSGPDMQEMPDDLKIQKDMVAFLYAHYAEKITLDDIAAAGNVSRSKCCRIFKYYLQQSPVDFLNACRLKVSCRLLDTTDQTITEIALACGFTHLSYFSKLFCAAYGYTPREYRRLKQLSRMTD